MARQLGYTEEELGALGTAGDPQPFDPAVRAALRYAGLMARDAHGVTDGFFAELREHYSDTQIFELTCVIGLASYWNRFTTALRIDLSGTDEPYDAPRPGDEGQ